MKVLMVLNHAPDYRESFLRELGKQVDLTVVAQPCEPGGLTAPVSRVGYQYVEISPFGFFGLLWQPGLKGLLRGHPWDVVCVSANLRHISRIFLFLSSPAYRGKWIWWGLIFGEIQSKFVAWARKWLLLKSAGCLVHSKSVSFQLKEKYEIEAVSFNNTETKRSEFRSGVFDKNHYEIRMLFVGTNKPRKKLERLIELAGRREDVSVRIVGPRTEGLHIPEDLKDSKKVEVFGRTTGQQLKPHFDWADLVVSPGNVGLLIMNAARHGKGIVVNNNSYHGPEFWLAKETGQPFISFDDKDEVDQFIDQLHENPSLLEEWGKALQCKAKQEYTIESMAETHVKVFESVCTGQQLGT